MNGVVVVNADGRITHVGPDSQVPRFLGSEAVFAPDCVLLPGLVNVHTHLELTGFAGSISDTAFFDWIQHIRRRKSDTTREMFLASARQGVRDAWAAGITTVADTGDTGAAAEALKEMAGRGIAYQEVFGPHPDQMEDSFAGLVAAVERLRAGAPASVRIGVSPHAPYTVSAPLFRKVADWAEIEGLPMAVHLAESPDETAFVTGGDGPFAEMWRRRQIPLPAPAESPVRYLANLGMLGRTTLVIHAVQTSAEDRRTLRVADCAVALCPRSNARHGHGAAPIAGYLRDGVRAGLGTDSVASVDALDLFAEARAAGELTGLEAPALLRLMTLGGATALRMEHEIGSLEAGKWADLCLVRVGSVGDPAAAGARVLAAGVGDVAGTWVAGRRVFGGSGIA
jgi:cytosine/adenosine deaminase-related metal-dependent hydrolase